MLNFFICCRRFPSTWSSAWQQLSPLSLHSWVQSCSVLTRSPDGQPPSCWWSQYGWCHMQTPVAQHTDDCWCCKCTGWRVEEKRCSLEGNKCPQGMSASRLPTNPSWLHGFTGFPGFQMGPTWRLVRKRSLTSQNLRECVSENILGEKQTSHFWSTMVHFWMWFPLLCFKWSSLVLYVNEESSTWCHVFWKATRRMHGTVRRFHPQLESGTLSWERLF